MRNNRLIGFLPLFITYIIVKIAHNLAGFDYDLFSEGIMNAKFLIDIMSWVIVYALIYFLLRKILPQRNM
jgi:hypothetical protein